MPRNGGNTLRPGSRNHKSMHSGRKGNGGDAKIKAAKQKAGQERRPAPRRRRHTEDD